MSAQNTYMIDVFSQWREWFDGVSRESGLVEFKEASDLAVENLATKGLQFENLQPGERKQALIDALWSQMITTSWAVLLISSMPLWTSGIPSPTM